MKYSASGHEVEWITNSYDCAARGNVVGRGAEGAPAGSADTYYMHNSENQLKSVILPDGMIQLHVYGPLGRRIAVQVSGSSVASSEGYVHAGEMDLRTSPTVRRA